ncbi:hypothetical protein LC087_11000 [Bacillus carboniphilus]|uniref:DUF4083 domain-containing protein n=1 Tax=Bacillus carboniphilus TaxID=86663 RepID=A0ABY9JSN8_9BACI|nr:hypothetical protein [Bacillus carboniphilus]WLR41430.1 hypothetical protein LC087_11000 [Bacillus carboniphilus]
MYVMNMVYQLVAFFVLIILFIIPIVLMILFVIFMKKNSEHLYRIEEKIDKLSKDEKYQ